LGATLSLFAALGQWKFGAFAVPVGAPSSGAAAPYQMHHHAEHGQHNQDVNGERADVEDGESANPQKSEDRGNE
jgi:hypothetical protein